MVDCFDRIAVQMTEIALEPIVQLAERPTTMSATVCLTSNGGRVLLTVVKNFPNGESAAPVYAWILARCDDSGQPVKTIATSPEISRYRRPDDAFWGAIDALRDVKTG
ncbi:hypothetical protein BH20CHL2_BH20CHL2_07680 [soil metagenome]|jgi:hypothetical protein